MQQKQKRSGFKLYAIFTTITLFAWVVYGVYERFSNIDLTSVPQKTIAPINPSLDTSVLDLLENKKYLDTNQINTFVPKAVETESTSGAIPESSPSGNL